MTAKKNPGGRPPTYKCKEEIEGKIEAYFKECEGEMLKNAAGEPVLNKWGNPVITNRNWIGFGAGIFYQNGAAVVSGQGRVRRHDIARKGKNRRIYGAAAV